MQPSRNTLPGSRKGSHLCRGQKLLCNRWLLFVLLRLQEPQGTSARRRIRATSFRLYSIRYLQHFEGFSLKCGLRQRVYALLHSLRFSHRIDNPNHLAAPPLIWMQPDRIARRRGKPRVDLGRDPRPQHYRCGHSLPVWQPCLGGHELIERERGQEAPFEVGHGVRRGSSCIWDTALGLWSSRPSATGANQLFSGWNLPPLVIRAFVAHLNAGMVNSSRACLKRVLFCDSFRVSGRFLHFKNPVKYICHAGINRKSGAFRPACDGRQANLPLVWLRRKGGFGRQPVLRECPEPGNGMFSPRAPAPPATGGRSYSAPDTEPPAGSPQPAASTTDCAAIFARKSATSWSSAEVSPLMPAAPVILPSAFFSTLPPGKAVSFSSQK